MKTGFSTPQTGTFSPIMVQPKDIVTMFSISRSTVTRLIVNDTLRMYKNDDIRMYNFNCITDTIVEVITTCNTYTLLTVHLL